MSDEIFVGGGGPDYASPQTLLSKYANRHGLIAGATGTGKTVTLQILAESFSAQGVPVFLSDVKSDLAGLGKAGRADFKLHDAFTSRAQKIDQRAQSMAIAALRATTEETRSVRGTELDLVRGTLLDTGKAAALHPGDLPTDPASLLAPARSGAEAWLDGDYGVMRFAPAPLSLRTGDGPPHIRLDRAAGCLLGDRL